jgi:hypothetical protein
MIALIKQINPHGINRFGRWEGIWDMRYEILDCRLRIEDLGWGKAWGMEHGA